MHSGKGADVDAMPDLQIDPRQAKSQGYRLGIRDGRISVIGGDEAGLFHGTRTLAQISRQFPESFPSTTIEDWPDFPVRGVMLDISRDKVPTMSTLLAIVDQLADLKINQLQLYTEHTFAYRNHQSVWKDASPMTAQEIRQLDEYCRDRFIELVPNQNSFGHLERWFKHPQYRDLAEAPDGFEFPWGTRTKTGFSLNPLDPRGIEFIESLYDELLPNFSSEWFNVGCDETFDIGLGRSRAEVQKRGRERVYLDFLLKIYSAVKRRGKKMMFWGDIILHKPELIGQLPRDLIALNWGYEADHPFEKETQAFRDAGVPYYVCPGTSSWCSISGRTDNALANLRNAAEQGLKHGAIGYLITDWGDYGHLQYLPVSWLGIAAGASYSWCLESNRQVSLAEALDLHIFRDRARVMGKLVQEFGNVYQAAGEPIPNSTRLFWALMNSPDHAKHCAAVTADQYAEALRRIDAAVAPIAAARMQCPDAELVRAEIHNAAAMLKYACRRAMAQQNPSSAEGQDLEQELRMIVAEHRRLWLARNRPGGLSDSASRLEKKATPSPT